MGARESMGQGAAPLVAEWQAHRLPREPRWERAAQDRVRRRNDRPPGVPGEGDGEPRRLASGWDWFVLPPLHVHPTGPPHLESSRAHTNPCERPSRQPPCTRTRGRETRPLSKLRRTGGSRVALPAPQEPFSARRPRAPARGAGIADGERVAYRIPVPRRGGLHGPRAELSR